MASKDLHTGPVFSPGAGVTEVLRNSFRIARGPDIAGAAGAASTAGTTTTIALFNVPANTYVKEIILDVKNKLATSCRQGFTVGDSDDVDRFFGSSGALVHSVGVKSSVRNITPTVAMGGHFYTEAHTINAYRKSSSKGTTTGHIHTYIVYAPNIEYFDYAS